MSNWKPIETAPKDEAVPVLVYYDHNADPYRDPANPDKLTDYACHADGGDYLAHCGVTVAVWREGWHENDGWESANPPYWMPAAWWVWLDGDAGDHVVNATHWQRLPKPPVQP